MFERHWIEFPWIQLVPNCRVETREGETRSKALFDVRLGEALTIHGWQISSDPKSDDPNWGWFGQNDAMANVRLIDVPGFHHEEEGFLSETILDNRISRAIALFCHRDNPELVRGYIEGLTEEVSFVRIVPESWGGKSLAIPVDFVKLLHVCRESSELGFAHIRLGGHLSVWYEVVFDPSATPPLGLQSRTIHDQTLVGLINSMLTAPENAPGVDRALAHEWTNQADKLDIYVGVEGADPDRVPPPPVEFH